MFGLGVVGIFLPVMPTVPFVIAAAYFFSKGSEKWHRWLLTHPRFGHYICDWQDHGIIRKKSKVLSSILILGSISSLMYFLPENWMKLLSLALFAAVLAFIWTRPSESPLRK